jgi:cytochrome P450
MKAPGPPSLPLIGHLPGFRRDVLGLLAQGVRDYGDLVRFKLGPREVILVNHPDAIRQVLKTNARNYDKDTRSTRLLSDICGESLLTANGDEWQRRRHTLQPAFHHRAVEGFASIIHEEGAALVERIAGHDDIEASSQMMQTTFRVVARALFGADLPDATTAALEAPIETLLGEAFARLGSLTGRRSREFRRAKRQLDEIVAGILSEILAKPRSADEVTDLLGLMRSGDYDEVDLRNESTNFLIAGHETTANALTWLLAHLAAHPEEQDRCAADPAALERALSETLRLSPPIWIVERQAIGADEIGGYEIPAGVSVVVCTYTLHRHRDFWEDPESFNPDRFLDPPPAAYLPFGLGPRVCIGREFALMEAKIIAAALLERYRFSLSAGGGVPVPEAAITLRVRGGLRLRLEPRSGS